MEEFGALLVGLLQVEIIGPVRQFEHLDTLLEVSAVRRIVGTDLAFEYFLLCFVPGVDVHPHLFVNLSIELVLIGLTHATADFAEFSRAIVHGLLMEGDFILLARFQRRNDPLEGVVIEVNCFDQVREFICQVLFTRIALTALPLKVRTAVVDVTASTLLHMLFCCDGTAAIAAGDQPHISEHMFLFSRLIVPMKRRLSRLEEFPRDQCFVHALIYLAVPAETSVVHRILENLFETSRGQRFP